MASWAGRGVVAAGGWALCALAQIPPSLPPAAEPPHPLIDPADELRGKHLVDALRKGGHVLYMRHALQIPPAVEEVCDKSSLTRDGEAQARKVGAILRELKIPIGAVKSSEPCRARDTGRLLDMGTVSITADLNPLGGSRSQETIAARKRLLAQPPAPGTNTILVSHVHGGRVVADRMQLEIAEIIAYRPGGNGVATPVARIRLEDWDELIKPDK